MIFRWFGVEVSHAVYQAWLLVELTKGGKRWMPGRAQGGRQVTGDIIREVGDRYYVWVWGTQRMYHISVRYDDVWESNWLDLFDSDPKRSAAMLRRAADELDKIDLKELPE